MNNELELSARRLHKSFEERQGSFHTPRAWASLSGTERQEFEVLASRIQSTDVQPLGLRLSALCREYALEETGEARCYFAARIKEAG